MIDKNPSVGRIVVRHDDRHDHHADLSSIGRITEISGKRIRYAKRADPLDPNRAEMRYLLDKTILCVCDTEQEVADIVRFEQDVVAMYRDVEARISQGWDLLVHRYEA